MEKEIQNKWEQTAKYSRKNAQDFLLFSSSLSLSLSGEKTNAARSKR